MDLPVDLKFVNRSGAWLCGGESRSPLSRVQWQAVVIPTLRDNPARGIVGKKYGVAMTVALTPKQQTRESAIDALKYWARFYGYCALDVLMLAPPMSDGERIDLEAATKNCN